MDYEVMMNGNIKIGQYAPEFEAKDNVFKQEALNNMQNVYEENRQRFLASIYNIQVDDS